MAIQNYICEVCQCANVCLVKKKLDAFHEDAKKPLETDIQILRCEDYKKIEDEIE